MGVATGCGCKEVYRFPHTTYTYSSCICSFLQQHPYFLFIFKCFSFLFQYFFVITFYVLNNVFTQYKHTYRQLRESHSSHMSPETPTCEIPSNGIVEISLLPVCTGETSI